MNAPKLNTEPAPAMGVGLGLRMAIGRELIERKPPEVAWLEIHPENYVQRGGRFRTLLDDAAQHWSLLAHGLSLSLGAAEPHDRAYIAELRQFLQDIRAPWYSDHLCFGGVGNAHLHDLLPLPRNAETVEHAVRRIQELQDQLGIPVAIENVSYYADSVADDMSEVEFLVEIAERADAKLLLDVNNIWVNSVNHSFDPHDYLNAVPMERVVQIHVAGHLIRPDGLIIDTHAEPVCGGVFELLETALRRTGPVPVLLERDGNFPPLDELLEEVRALVAVYDRATAVPA